MKQKNILLMLFPVMIAFFVMGFVDLVGTATTFVKADFGLSDTMANLLPSMVFLWFLLLSVPTGMLMNRIGRRKTVVLSLAVTSLALLVPILGYSFYTMIISFSLLGIGNTLMQVSLNPLLSNMVQGGKLASYMTLGQFIKAIASFIAPIIAAWAAKSLGDWRYLFPVFMAVSIVATFLLGFTSIDEEGEKGRSSSFTECFSLLGDKLILLSFIGIMCHVGIDVGTNVTAPKILEERLGMPSDDAVYATSVYFLFRTIGCFIGTFILSRYSARKFFMISAALIIAGIAGLFFTGTLMPMYACIAMIGLGNSNIFPVIVSQALLYMPDKKNEVSGLMIMGLFGGTVFPVIMGLLSDGMGTQTGALWVLGVGALYLTLISGRLKDKVA